MSGRRHWVYVKSIACALCGSATLAEWMALHGFPTADAGLPYSLSGASLTGTTIFGDIASDGASFGRVGSGDLGGGLVADTSVILFPGIVGRDCTFSYEYRISSGGKHRILIHAEEVLNTAGVSIGSWSSNSSNTIGEISAGVNQFGTVCSNEYPPAELSGVLPQTSGVWRTRTLVKAGRTITMTDGTAGPITITRCFFPLRGYLGMVLGPGVRVRNVSISL